MTALEAEILEALMPAPGGPGLWRRPMDFGGERNSSHAVVAARMVARGWVERQERMMGCGRGVRPSWEYRITQSGIQARFNAGLGRGDGQAASGPGPTIISTWTM